MERVKYVRTEVLDIYAVRDLCIRNNFYTCGTNSQYMKMFDMCKEARGSIDDLELIATDIFNHSDRDEFEDYGYLNDYECIAWIIRLLIEECTRTTISIEEA